MAGHITRIIVGSTMTIIDPINNAAVKQVIHKFCFSQLASYDFDYRIKRMKLDRKYFKHDGGVFKIPTPFVDRLKTHLDSNIIKYQIEEADLGYEPRKVSLPITKSFKLRDNQIEPVEYLSTGDKARCGLELQTGCITGDATVNITVDGVREAITLSEAFVHKIRYVGATITALLDSDIGENTIIDIMYSGKKMVYELILANGKSLRATGDHRIMTSDGWEIIEDLLDCSVMCGDNPAGPCFSQAISIEPIGVVDTYDIECAAPHHNFVANGIVVHNSGKTAVSIVAACNIGEVWMVIVSGLVDMWVKSITEKTSCGDDIYVLQGVDSIKSLFESDKMPNIFVASLETMRAYVAGKDNYEGVPEYSELIKRYGIGTRILDEAHRDLGTTTMFDLAANIKRNIYLTATFETNNTSLKRIFGTYFPSHFKYGGAEYSRYVDITMYGFNGVVSDRACVRQRGYSHILYEQFLMKKPTLHQNWYNTVLLPIVTKHHIKRPESKGRKLLIFCATIAFIGDLCDRLSGEFPDLVVLPKVTGSPKSVLEEADVIISTHKGTGTGCDIADLLTVINTVSTQSPVTTNQMLGRLRKLPEADVVPHMVDVVDVNCGAQMRHYRVRANVYKQLGKTYNNYRIN